MAREHYYLQYLIYTIILYSSLGLCLPDYDYKTHLRGVFSRFLYGLDHSDTGHC